MNEAVQPKHYAGYPGGRLLLHSCCAPCSGDIARNLLEDGVDFTVFFYNPNVHPVAEYERRKEENKAYCRKLGVSFIDGDYDVQAWLARVKGFEGEPERGPRCTRCFTMRLERSALYAVENGFSVLATTLGLSRHKDQAQVYTSAARAAGFFEELAFWPVDWRKGGGTQRADALAREEGFYRQDYCGCAYSLRDALEKRGARASEI